MTFVSIPVHSRFNKSIKFLNPQIQILQEGMFSTNQISYLKMLTGYNLLLTPPG